MIVRQRAFKAKGDAMSAKRSKKPDIIHNILSLILLKQIWIYQIFYMWYEQGSFR